MKLFVLYIGLISVASATKNNRIKVKTNDYQEYNREQFQRGQKVGESYGNTKERNDYNEDKRITVNNKGNEDRQEYEGSKEYVLTSQNSGEYKCDPKLKDLYETCNDRQNEMGRYDNDVIYKNFDKNNKDYFSSYNYKDGYDNIDQFINLIGLANNDIEDTVRPCFLDDWECIRKFFSKNSKCKPAYGPIPDPLYFERNIVYFPNVNVTNVRTRLQVSGLSNFKISEFYFNKNTGNLVLALNFKNLTQYTPKAYVRYKRTARESIVLSDFAAVMFKSGTFTAVIPKIPQLRLDLAEVHANIDDAVPNLVFGPGAFNSTDPDVVAAFAELTATLPILSREEFLLTSQLYISIYIQAYLCDFGLKLYSI